ncbi:hypothetical protein DL93DRAFT_1762908 [Clavulina sp. PMI_390]|nr:hypothetical protein DL93DRAFT_1762908 [Clavulina sp. PMI_390]
MLWSSSMRGLSGEEFYCKYSGRTSGLPRRFIPPLTHLRHLILFPPVPTTLLQYLDAPELVRFETISCRKADHIFALPLSSPHQVFPPFMFSSSLGIGTPEGQRVSSNTFHESPSNLEDYAFTQEEYRTDA